MRDVIAPRVSCVGAAICRTPACRRADGDRLDLLATTFPAPLAHRTLNAVAVVTGDADLLVDGTDDLSSAARQVLDGAMGRRAPDVGWSCQSLGSHLDTAVVEGAARWVVTACRLGRSPDASDEERRVLLAQVAAGVPELADELSDVVRGVR